MLKLFAVILTLLAALPVAAFAQSYEFSISTGRRADNLDWNIAGMTPSAFGPINVDVLSELSWKDIESQEIRAAARVFFNRYILKGEAGYGFITGGVNQDSDFGGNGRTLEFSRSNNLSDDGSVWDLSAGLGYPYKFKALGGSFDLTPMAGLSYFRQNLTITDGVQTISTPGLTPALGPFGGLDSTYKAGWAGPWAGAEVAYQRGKLRVFGNFEYHIAYFTSEADWNLRTDFSHPVSFEQWATGSGVVFSAGTEYNIAHNWSFMASFEASDFKAKDGTDRTFFASGAVVDTPLNEANWDSMSAFFGFNYRF